MRELVTGHTPSRAGVSVGMAATGIVAAATGLGSALIGGTHGDAPIAVLRVGVFAALFAGLALHDLATRTIPNRVVYPATVLAVVTAWVWGDPEPDAALLGGALAFAAFALIRAVTRGIGGGDVKFACLVGFVVGAAALPLALTLTALSGGAAALVLLVSGRAARGAAMPYGPFIALGGVAALMA